VPIRSFVVCVDAPLDKPTTAPSKIDGSSLI
jgi:hypothetical protein